MCGCSRDAGRCRNAGRAVRPTWTMRAAACRAIIAEGLLPAALEMVDQRSDRGRGSSVYAAGLPTDVGALLIIEFDGLRRRAAARRTRCARELRAASGRARSARARTTRRSGSACGTRARKRTAQWAGWRPTCWCRTPWCRAASCPRCCARSTTIAGTLRPQAVQHVSRRRWQPAPDHSVRPARHRRRCAAVEQASKEMMRVCVRAGGTITGEHGVGHGQARVHGPDLQRCEHRPHVRCAARVQSARAGQPRQGSAAARMPGVGRTGNAARRGHASRERERERERERGEGFGRGFGAIRVWARMIESLRRSAGKARVLLGAVQPPRSRACERRHRVSDKRGGSRCGRAVVRKREASRSSRRAAAPGWATANRPSERRLVLSLRKLKDVSEYEPADLVVSVQAGMTLDDAATHYGEQNGSGSRWILPHRRKRPSVRSSRRLRPARSGTATARHATTYSACRSLPVMAAH